MKILMTGGGSGGHITPILAVAHEIKRLHPDAEIVYVGQRGDGLLDIPAADPNIDAVHSVWAGKLRRYNDEDWRQWFNVRTQALNLRDLLRVVRGLWQSFWLIRRLKPDVIFTRGGFVSVPVAIGGRLNGVPYITHDSDSIPSLANRLIARWAVMHAVALPKEVYPYPKAKTVTVGVPVSDQYRLVTAELKERYKRDIKAETYAQVLFLTGGGNGARVLNEALVANTRYLLRTFPELLIVHVAGRTLEAETNQAYDTLQLGTARERVRVLGFVSDMYRYSGAADVVVGRAGATSFAEFAQQAKACIMVPPKQLPWAVKNSQELAAKGAIVELTEDQIEQPERFGRAIGALLEGAAERKRLAYQLAAYAHPQAAAELAELLIDIIEHEGAHATAKR